MGKTRQTPRTLEFRRWLGTARMTNVSRDVVFISHANPEDNAFTVWLESRLTAAGYAVWADVLGLRGGQDLQRRLEDCLRNGVCKVLLVGTEHGVAKKRVRVSHRLDPDGSDVAPPGCLGQPAVGDSFPSGRASWLCERTHVRRDCHSPERRAPERHAP